LHWFYEKHIQGGGVLDAVIRFATEAGPDAPAADVLRSICGRMNLERIAKELYVRPYDAAIVMKSIAGLLSIAGTQTVRQFFDSINAAEVFAVKYRDKDVLTLDCVANSKGQEFDHVILPFVEQGEYPNPMFPMQDEENLFYVGATRARRWLTLTTPDAIARQSDFIRRMDITGTRARANLAQARNDNALQSATPARHYLRASYADKDQVKALGARYDPTRKQWYVPVGMDLKPFEPWF
jgi:DNA helicase-2/ATP-dependent DNA helicase PcrA